ncbi:2-oxoglutarate oxidoreductase subunit KorA [bacterium BMS3Abin07]|nr:2-oxoglutarate oxidoreductase subunit KorA [bacterium BMS3Abin07]GBE32345.1 2-oxoglutarate oxidoreductase subunit KorA [bacterium BMS3Bbin05]HDO21707.1 2-oxoacid:acceptor oxidoreductase subunit alpha [Nitrospirota bacterium]HDZ87656.1 2-oxoacid:acceptor oxidoreductase subunit alpha [Nitrospirota bacterium]
MNKGSTVKISGDVSIVLCGAAGQGIQTIEQILPRVLKRAGYNVFATKEYMSRVRGGSNSTQIRVSSRRVSAYLDRIDILIPLDNAAIPHLKKRISPDTVIIGDSEKLSSDLEFIDVPFSGLAKKIGGTIYENIVAVGMLSGMFRLDIEMVSDFIMKFFSKKKEDIVRNNITAFKKGYETGTDFCRSGKFCIDIGTDKEAAEEILISGSEAVGLGAIAGGCNFISAYPMTPSTGVFTFLAQHSDNFDIIVEQAEDEIAAMNMQLGAWYAGARAMVTTSGGGLALMVEGISLAGMIESPAVIYLAQRPGPATGLPTRTEQGDLEMALYSGHGEFPRVIYTPGTLEDAFYLTQKAFNVADKYQIPVFVLSDQNLADLIYNLPLPDMSAVNVERYIIKTGSDYKRYELTEDGISPRGIPGYGAGIIGADSDEHNEDGHITEDLDLRIKMVDKRLKKLDLVRAESVPPELIGNENYETLVVGWGSTHGAIKEALENIGSNDISYLYIKQVYPLHPDITDYLENAEKTIIVENNATSQFGKLIKLYLGMEFDSKVLKYDGMPFSVEELAGRISREAAI